MYFVLASVLDIINLDILTDFQIPPSDRDLMQPIFYNPNFPRWNNFTSTGQLQRIQFRVYYEKVNQQYEQLYLRPGETADILFELRRKEEEIRKLEIKRKEEEEKSKLVQHGHRRLITHYRRRRRR